MFASHSRPYHLVWCLLTLLSCWSAAQLTLPAIAEVDLIFPHNDTYAPTALLPVVFAVQNSRLGLPLRLRFEYNIYAVGGNKSLANQGTLDLGSANFTSISDPYFAYQSDLSVNTEGTWVITWSVTATNCSQETKQISLINKSSQVIFTTKNGAKQPDLVAATADGTCASNQSYAFNVTGTVDSRVVSGSQDSCAVVAPMLPSLAANPCGAKVKPSVASSISAAVTSRYCEGALNPVVTCPPNTRFPSKSGGERRSGKHLVGGVAWLVGACSWFIYILVL